MRALLTTALVLTLFLCAAAPMVSTQGAEGSPGDVWVIIDGPGAGTLLVTSGPGSLTVVMSIMPFNIKAPVGSASGSIIIGDFSDCKALPGANAHFHGSAGGLSDNGKGCGLGHCVKSTPTTLAADVTTLLMKVSDFKSKFSSLDDLDGAITELCTVPGFLDSIQTKLDSKFAASGLTKGNYNSLTKKIAFTKKVVEKLKASLEAYQSGDKGLAEAFIEVRTTIKESKKTLKCLKRLLKSLLKAGAFDEG